MTWNYLGNLVVNNDWQFLPATNNNLIKLIHSTTIPYNSYWDLRGLIGKCLGESLNEGIGEIRKLLSYPETQYYLFKPLPSEIQSRYVLKGAKFSQTTYEWYVTAWVWNEPITDITATPFEIPELTKLNEKSDQQLNQLNQIIEYLTLPPGQNFGNNPNLYI